MNKEQEAGVVVNQPQYGQSGARSGPDLSSMNWAPAPVGAIPLGCPPGLEYLTQVDQVIIKQQKEMIEIFTGWEQNNRYRITNSVGQQVLFAMENTDACTRQCCGPGRPFEMSIYDNYNREVIHLSRPLRCRGPLCPCSQQEISVLCNGTEISKVHEKNGCAPGYYVHDGQGQSIFEVTSGMFPNCKCSDVPFQITSCMNGEVVGAVTKQWMGCGWETCTDVATYSVNFPLDLDVKLKAALIGATFLIDFNYYERDN